MRLIPPQFVRPFVKSNKNDYKDAEAIAEAVQRAQFSYPDFLDLHTDRFPDVFAAGLPSFGGLRADRNAMQFGYNLVTSNYFAALGINPAAGRLLVRSFRSAARRTATGWQSPRRT